LSDKAANNFMTCSRYTNVFIGCKTHRTSIQHGLIIDLGYIISVLRAWVLNTWSLRNSDRYEKKYYLMSDFLFIEKDVLNIFPFLSALMQICITLAPVKSH
jgi:hypothetical protein